MFRKRKIFTIGKSVIGYIINKEPYIFEYINKNDNVKHQLQVEDTLNIHMPIDNQYLFKINITCVKK